MFPVRVLVKLRALVTISPYRGDHAGVCVTFQLMVLRSGLTDPSRRKEKIENMKPTTLVMSLLALAMSLVTLEAEEAAKLPRVLIIGDSISIGYTDPVRQELHGVANVFRPGTNCGPTQLGLANLKTWLGNAKWDVIHFNFGIWDTHLLDPKGHIIPEESNIASRTDIHQRTSPEQYRDNLTKLVETLEGTGAKLIWASTTQIASRTGKRHEAISELNKVAAEVMKAHNIPIDDLYSYTLPHKEWQQADQCHYNALGCRELGKQVAKCIRDALKSKMTSQTSNTPLEKRSVFLYMREPRFGDSLSVEVKLSHNEAMGN